MVTPNRRTASAALVLVGCPPATSGSDAGADAGADAGPLHVASPAWEDQVIYMANVTTSWGPDQGFDHVVFNIYFQLPGQAGVTVMPNLFSSTPAGLGWRYAQRTGGWKADAKMFSSSGASDTSFGSTVPGPKVKVNGKAITFEYDRNVLGLGTWNGVRVYVATWDYDGLSGAYRGLSQAGGNYEFGRGNPTAPHVMDDVPPITLTYP